MAVKQQIQSMTQEQRDLIAQHKALIEKTDDRMRRIRSVLIMDNPWFGALALRLILKPCFNGTMSVDGTTLRFDPRFVEKLNNEELKAVVAHEVMHCALRHMYRIQGRNMLIWNIACDFVINLILTDSGFKLPTGCLLDRKYKDMFAEQVYALLIKDLDEWLQKAAGGAGGCTGEFTEPGKGDSDKDAEEDDGSGGDASDDTEPMSEFDWQVAVEAATATAKKAGHMPGGAEKLLELEKTTAEEFDEVVRKFLSNQIPSDQNWNRPDRRFVGKGQYMPGRVKTEGMPAIAIGMDTSGSTSHMIDHFGSKLYAFIKEFRPKEVIVYWCDYDVQKREVFTPDEEIDFKAEGFGGTRFQPVFDAIAENEDEICCLIYFTDLEGSAPTEPDYPVLWVTDESVSDEGFFGETVRIKPLEQSH